MAHVVALDFRPGQGLYVGKRQYAPEAAGGKPICLAAPESEPGAIRTEPVADILREDTGTLAIGIATGGVGLCQDRIDQRVKMHGEGDVVIDAFDRPVAIPAFAEPESLDLIEISFGLGLVEAYADAGEAEIDENPEEFPVVVDEFLVAGRQEVGRDGFLLILGERLPDMFGHHGESKTHRGQFHLTLVAIGDVTPIFRVRRVGAVCKAAAVEVPIGELLAAGCERHYAPERSGETFEVGRCTVEMRAGGAQANPRAALRKIRQKRFEQVKDRLAQIVSGQKRIPVKGLARAGS